MELKAAGQCWWLSGLVPALPSGPQVGGSGSCLCAGGPESDAGLAAAVIRPRLLRNAADKEDRADSSWDGPM